MNDPLRVALLSTLIGLREKIPDHEEGEGETSFANLRWMIDKCVSEIELFPIDKTSRWIGFIQGVLATRGVLSVREERDRTRPYFHAAYASMGLSSPKSAER